VVRKVAKGGADAVLLTPGIARMASRELVGTDTSLLLRIDGTATSIGPHLTNDELISSVESALRIGADAVATFGVIGVPREAQLSQKNGGT
jgi:DhnA family fructose-bisphosphate aldolase class Ia